MQPNFPIRRLAWCLSALFLTVVGAKFWLIQGCATPIFCSDEWTEANNFFKPWVEGHLTWAAWFAPHNHTHRLFFTRLLELVCVKLNGEWDPLLHMTVNTLLHAGIICGLVYCLWVFTGRKDPALLSLVLVPFLALPVAAENTLMGMQSQIYFLIGFAVIAMAGLGFHPPGSQGWLLGLVAAVLSFFTIASGFLAALAVAGLMVLRSLQARRLQRDHLITAGACLTVFALGAALNAQASSGVVGAPSWSAILATLAWTLAWPFENKPTMLVFTCLPLALTAVKYFKGQFKDPRAAEFLLTLGLWGFLQSAAVAYGRTSFANSSRYGDLFSVIPMASLASLFILGGGELFQRLSRGRQAALATGWTAILLGGLWHLSPRDWQNHDDTDSYPLWSAQTLLLQQENIRAFVATGDPASLRHYPDFETMTNVLLHPQLSRILPVDCRPPLPLAPDAGTTAAFVPGGYAPDRPPREYGQAWGNYSTNGVVVPGRFVSRPLTARLPRLQLELCCASADQLRIELVGPGTLRHVSVPPPIPGPWHTLNLPAPANPFRLEISADNPAAWVAVGALRESGRWSYAARKVLDHSVLILLSGLLLFAGLIAYDLFRQTPGPRFLRWLALGVVLAVLVRIWPERHFDATQFTCDLYANGAKHVAQARHPGEARHLLREALWLRPEDPQLQAQLRALSQPAGGKGMAGQP